MPGPTPKPTVLNNLKGDPGRRRRNTVEPEPPRDRPVPPDDLTPVAREEWDRITSELDSMNLLSSADRAALVLYVEAFARYESAKKASLLQKYENGVVQVSAAYTILHKERDIMRRLLEQFGLTPAARARMAVTKDKANENDPLLSFLKLKTA